MFKIFINDLDAAQVSAIEHVKDWISWAEQEAKHQAPKYSEVDPSDYWSMYVHIFSYVKNLPAPLFSSLRLHTHHLDGDTYAGPIGSYTGGGPISSPTGQYTNAADRLRSGLPEQYWISAPHACGEYGQLENGRLVNDKVLKWQSILRELWYNGAFVGLEVSDRPVILEIGAGYGGIAHHFKTMFPNALYVIVDLPETLLFSASYLSMIHGQDSVVLMDNDSPLDPKSYSDASFIMVPNFMLPSLDNFRFHFALNMDSFQEMTEAQVNIYLKFLSNRTDLLFSKNIDEFGHSNDKVNVTSLLNRYFDLTPMASSLAPLVNKNSPRKIIRRFAGKFRNKLVAAMYLLDSKPSGPVKPGGSYLATPKSKAAKLVSSVRS